MFAETAATIVRDLPRGEAIDIVSDLGEIFAVRAQCAWLGWPAEIEQELIDWMAENYRAAVDPKLRADVAAAFDAIVAREVARARAGSVTAALTAEEIDGRRLGHAEVVSILRNWTAGDLGSLARCVGVVVRRLAREPRLQARVRQIAGRDPVEFEAILAECLRLEDPFPGNRRRATCPASLPSGARVAEDETVVLDWAAANTDPEAFGGSFDPAAHAEKNIVFGVGPHVCPGRELSYAELSAVVTELLAGTADITPGEGGRVVLV